MSCRRKASRFLAPLLIGVWNRVGCRPRPQDLQPRQTSRVACGNGPTGRLLARKAKGSRMTRMVILAGTALISMAGSEHARQWFFYNFESLRCESRSGDTASPVAWHKFLRQEGIIDTIEIVKDLKTNEVTTTTISAELPHNRSPSSWIWFTSKKLCARAAIKLEPRMEDIE